MTEDTLTRTDIFFDRYGPQLRATSRADLWKLQREAQSEIFDRFCQDLSRMMLPTQSYLRHIEAQIKRDFEL